jgi:hypothetical protein
LAGSGHARCVQAASAVPPEGAERGVSRESVVISLQTLLDAKFVVGGRTALELQGFADYLSSAPHREVHLYGTDERPAWILGLNRPAQCKGAVSERRVEGRR